MVTASIVTAATLTMVIVTAATVTVDTLTAATVTGAAICQYRRQNSVSVRIYLFDRDDARRCFAGFSCGAYFCLPSLGWKHIVTRQ